jgi:hypothetical protein
VIGEYDARNVTNYFWQEKTSAMFAVSQFILTVARVKEPIPFMLKRSEMRIHFTEASILKCPMMAFKKQHG